VSTAVLSLESPPGFVVREEAHKAAYENGFRIDLGASEGWLRYRSTTARGDIWIAHAGVAAELDMSAMEGISGPGFGTYAFASLQQLYRTLERVYKLGVSLPNAPLASFKKATAHLPRTTEAERLTVERVGQSLFRQALLEYWNGRCPLTGIADPALLRASHIVPWAECESDALRRDVHNGLLLSALWGAAFDCGLIGFANDGTILRSPKLTTEAAAALNLNSALPLPPFTDTTARTLPPPRPPWILEACGLFPVQERFLLCKLAPL
jgi:hypothetical protein